MDGYFFFLALWAAWVKAEAATLRTAEGVLGLLSSFPAFEATFGLVFSLSGFLVI